MSEKPTPSSYSTVLYASELVTIGHFHLPANSPDFQTAGAISRPTMVFPRTQMWIEKQNQRRYLSHPNLLNFYDGTERYVRYQNRENDDICDWFEFSPVAIFQALSSFTDDDDKAAWYEADISQLGIVPYINTANAYLNQRRLIDALICGKVTGDAAQLISMELLDEALSVCAKKDGKHKLPEAKRLRYQDIAASAEQYILNNLNHNFALEDLATALAVSPFHLCRIFKLINGISILDFKLQLRLRLSLGDLAVSRDIAQLALEHGFASHSHYCTKFKRIFGCTPRQFREQIRK